MNKAIADDPDTLFLKRLLRRSVLNEEERAAILALPGENVDVPAHRDFVGLGELVDHACIVLDGLVARFAQTAAGERQIIALHIPGDAADLHSVVSPRAVSPLQALTPVRIHRIPHHALVETATRYPAIAHAFWRDGIVDLGIIAQSLLSIGRRRALARLAHLLCELALRYKQIGLHRDEFEFGATQQHLGDVLGLTSVHVNRTARALREAGLAVIADRRVKILDWSGLVNLAEFDPSYLQLDRLDRHP